MTQESHQGNELWCVFHCDYSILLERLSNVGLKVTHLCSLCRSGINVSLDLLQEQQIMAGG